MDVVLNLLAHIGVGLFIFVWCAHLAVVVKSVQNLQKLKRRRKISTSQDGLPGVTILKPVVGADATLKRNLATFFQLDYPNRFVEIVFCVPSANDSSLPIIAELRAEFPELQSSISIGTATAGINPKINNIVDAYDAATHDLIWICDSGVATAPWVLGEMVEIAIQTGDLLSVVHQLPTLHQCNTFTDCLEQQFFGTKHSRWYTLFDMLEFNCVNGMSMLFSRNTLATVGGLRPFGKYLAEDFFISEALHARGFRPRMALTPARQQFHPRPFMTMYSRHLRWMRLRRSMMFYSTLAEPIFECLVIGPIGVFSAQRLQSNNGAPWFIIFGFHIILWFLSDSLLMKILHPHGRLPCFLSTVQVWATREIGCLFLYLHAMSATNVVWRGTWYGLETGGTVKIR